MDELDRRTLLRTGCVAAIGSFAAGCLEREGPAEEDPGIEGPDEGIQDEAESGPDADELETLEEEPSYGDWFENTTNYDGTIDRRERESERVLVGAGENGFLFEPAAIAVSPGTTVTWEWTGRGGSHNVVEEDETFASELTEVEGPHFEYTFEESGIYRYLCEPHADQGMRGAISVE